MKEDGSRDSLIILPDNIGGQVQAHYQDIWRLKYSALCCYFPPEYTDELETPDDESGAQIKHWFGIGLDVWKL